jgi:hypothetical protein
MAIVTDATLGASAFWLGTQTGAGGTATLASSFFSRSQTTGIVANPNIQ